MKYPTHRPRRLRQTDNLRRLVRETHLAVDQLVMPYFVEEGLRGKSPIASMPGQFRFSIPELMHELKELERTGVRHILLFGIPKRKDDKALQAYHPKGIVQEAVREAKKRYPSFTVITDVCLCEYMSHGHCGVIKNQDVDNEQTLELLIKTALSHAEAGADLVAPSDMMDGRVGAIRQALDRASFQRVPILSYAAKFASAFYGPFREAASSKPQFGDRKSYQMDPANFTEALREIELDIEEGADLVMVKPALPCLDIIREAKLRFQVPVAAYQVSGEYAMIKSAAAAGSLNEKDAVLESLTAIRRAGAQVIVTYFAKEAAGLLRE